MKPSPFVYHRPADLGEALEVLAEVGADGKVLAGGQSLVPLMSMRLAAPAHVVDINGLVELGGVRVGNDGVRVGARVRHAELERDEAAYRVVPLLRRALSHVAHPTIRNRGTTVGSLAHADPAGEMTGVLALLGGSVRVRSRTAERLVHADEFFVGPLESAVKPDELATEAFFPAPPPDTGSAWLEVSRRNGDYAVCGVGALVTMDADGRISAARVGLISVDATPVVIDVVEGLAGQPADTAEFAAAGQLVESVIDPQPDIHATADYRRHLATVLTERALRQAATEASEGVGA
jgi:carbon-monoxide dehydrogenase medium subunit